MKTIELIGAALDWAVHTAQGLSDECCVVVDNIYGPQWRGPEYSTSWQEGGPIIEREGIATKPFKDGGEWLSKMTDFQADGPTPLIAAMRCYVASKLGDEVDIPAELEA